MKSNQTSWGTKVMVVSGILLIALASSGAGLVSMVATGLYLASLVGLVIVIKIAIQLPIVQKAIAPIKQHLTPILLVLFLTFGIGVGVLMLPISGIGASFLFAAVIFVISIIASRSISKLPNHIGPTLVLISFFAGWVIENLFHVSGLMVISITLAGSGIGLVTYSISNKTKLNAE